MPYGNMMFGGQMPIGNNWQQALASKLFGGMGQGGASPPGGDMAMAQLLGLYQPQGGGNAAMGRPMLPGSGMQQRPYGMGFGGGLYGQPVPMQGGGGQFANPVQLPGQVDVRAMPQPMPAPAPAPAPMQPRPMPSPRMGSAAFQGRADAQAFQQMTEGLSTPQINMLRRRYGM